MTTSTRGPTGLRRTAGFIALACALASAAPAAAQQLQTIRYILALPSMSLVTANQTSVPTALGYFKDEGLRIEATAAGRGGVSAATQLVASGQQDVGSGTQSAILARAAEGQDLGVSFFYNQLRDFHYVIGVLPGSGIRDVKDLKGKQIGVSTLASEGVVTAKYFARSAGLDPDRDLTFVAIGTGPQALQAIKTGQVAAISNLESSFVPMEGLGQKFDYLALPSGTEHVFGPGLFAKRDYIEANKKQLAGLGRAIAKSTLFQLNNPEAAIRIHWQAYPEQKPTGMSEDEAIRQGIRTLEVQAKGLMFQPGEPREWGGYTPKSWVAYLDIYGLTPKVPDASKFYTNALVPEFNSFDQAKVVEQAKTYKMP